MLRGKVDAGSKEGHDALTRKMAHTKELVGGVSARLGQLESALAE